MNKAFVYILALLTIATVAFAQPANDCNGFGDAQQVCECNGFDVGLAKYNWNATSGQFEKDSGIIDITSLTGNGDSADWTNSGYVSGVLVHAGEGQELTALPGGFIGNVNPADHDISFIAFCGTNGGGDGGDDDDGGDNQVPVFPGFTIGLAVIGAGLGLALLRKHN